MATRKDSKYPPNIRYPKPKDFKPEADYPEGDGRRGGRRDRCQAWAPTQNRQCLKFAMTGKRVCRNHGGRTPGGIASAVAKTFKYSKYLPGDLKSLYADAMTDKTLLSLSNEIAVIDARLQSLMAKIEKSEAGASWDKIRRAYTEFSIAVKVKDRLQSERQFQLLGELIDEKYAEWSAWMEIKESFELRRRLVETERKIEIDRQLYLKVDTALTWFQGLALIVAKYVKDQDTLTKIQNEWNVINAGGYAQRAVEAEVTG